MYSVTPAKTSGKIQYLIPVKHYTCTTSKICKCFKFIFRNIKATHLKLTHFIVYVY